MMQINLLPYRESLYKKKQQTFILVIVGILIIFGLFYDGVYHIFSDRVIVKKAQVTYLQSVEKSLDVKIHSIIGLRKKRAELIARENVITGLQNKRNRIVQIFNALSVEVPKGVFLSTLKEAHGMMEIHGYAQGNSEVAQFMRHIAASRLFEHAHLHIISASQLDKKSVEAFTLTVRLRESVNKNENGTHKGKKQ